MNVNKTVSTKVVLSRNPEGHGCNNSHPVKVDGEVQSFRLDGQLDSFVPTRRPGDVRTLHEAASVVQDPAVQKALDGIRYNGTLGSKVDLGERGTWDVYGHFGTFSVSRLDPKDGNRHRIDFSSRHLSIYNETTVGDDRVKQEVVANYDLHSNNFKLKEERLTIIDTVS